jgi:ribosomal peptide maturation radical SAM protein 1
MEEFTMDVLLVVPPFASAAFPNLGAGVIAAACRKHDLSVFTLYANLDYAAAVEAKRYGRMIYSAPSQMACEAVFSGYAFPDVPDSTTFLFEKYQLRDEPGTAYWDVVSREDFDICRAQAEQFINDTVQSILEMEPRLVGFSSMFQQNFASLAIARRLKKASPGILTVMGGANAQLPMGRAFTDVADAIDCVFAGQAELVFPEFCQQYISGLVTTIPELIDCGTVKDPDAIPIPEYSEYLEKLRVYQSAGKLPKDYPLCLYFESSRGCWWGVKSHCRFCGMNGRDLTYRSKSPQRVINEIQVLVRRYGIKKLTAVDCIMPEEMPRLTLKQLEDKNLGLDLHYEVKANIKKDDLDLLARAGVNTIQPGIESLSTPVLIHLGKGVTALQNLCLLRDGLSRRIKISWSLLIGVPGELSQDYIAVNGLLPVIYHLQPPARWGPVRLDRFSPYFTHPDEFNISSIRVYPALRAMYPPGAIVQDLSYRFLADWHTEFLENKKLVEKLGQLLEQWRGMWTDLGNCPRLNKIRISRGRIFIQDSRPCAVEPVYIGDAQTSGVLDQLESPLPSNKAGDIPASILNQLLMRKFVIEYEGCLLSVVTDMALGPMLRQKPGKAMPTANPGIINRGIST